MAFTLWAAWAVSLRYPAQWSVISTSIYCLTLYGVPVYASAQGLDFLDLAKNSSFPNQKLVRVHPEFPDGH
jgi:hypothetical protein